MTNAQSDVSQNVKPKFVLGIAVLIVIVGLLDSSGAVLGWISRQNPNSSELLSPDMIRFLKMLDIRDILVGMLFIVSGVLLYITRYVSIIFFVLGIIVYIGIGLFVFGVKSIGFLNLLFYVFVLYQMVDFKKKGWIS